jgi:hypothetical protein
MATGYKYQERDLDSQVNYADIGLGISNLVTDQLATRKAKKEAYDDQVRAFNQYLDEHPKGDDINMTEWTADYSSQMQQQMLANQRAFKNGRISERDNVVFMQNVQNGTKTMFDLSTDYQAEYADKMARMKSNDPANKSQYLESFLAQDAEGYGNFKNAKPIIDPKTGLVLMSIKQKDGTYQTVSAANLQTRIKAKYDYFDTDAVATSVEEGIGEEITSTLIAANRSRGGQITAVEDKELKDGFKDALTSQLNSYLVDQPLNVSSILTNTLKGKYDYTFSRAEAEKDPTKILLTTVPGGNGTPIPDFSTENGKKQQKEALDYMYQQVIQKIDRKVEQQEIGKYQDRALGSSGGRGGGKVDTLGVTLWDQLRWGNVEEKNQAAQSLVQMKFDDGLIGINFDEMGNVKLQYDPESGFTDNTITLKDKSPLEWAQLGSEVHKIKDMNKVAEIAGTSFNRPYKSIGVWKRKNGKMVVTNPQDFDKAGHRRNIE